MTCFGQDSKSFIAVHLRFLFVFFCDIFFCCYYLMNAKCPERLWGKI